MRVLAARCKTYDGSILRTDTPENTVADLIKSGFLTPCNSRNFSRLFHGVCNVRAGSFLVLNEFNGIAISDSSQAAYFTDIPASSEA